LSQKEASTASNIPIKPVYNSAPAENEPLGQPGEFPYTRGIYAGMYRDRLWTMRQYSGFGSAKATNERFKFLISQGQTGLSTAFDLPTQLGYDSDSSRSEGEVGRVGVPISTIENMRTLFNGIRLSEVSTSMTINATAAIMLAMYAAVGRIQGVPLKTLRGTTQNDILKEYIARNTYIFPPEQSLRLTTDVIEFCAQHMPSWHPISISGYHIRESGSTAVQELAYAFSNAKEYVRACVKRGMNVDEFAPHLSFFFASHNDFFEEIAKFRTARTIWAHIMRDEFQASKPESLKLRFHTQTSGETLTAQQPQDNVVRVALQALAAVLGGTQSLHTNSLDEALSLPTEDAVKLALRTQQIIAYESGVTHTADPVGGSYYLESLTSELEQAVIEEIAKVDRIGGSVAAIQKGYIQTQIRESAYKQQMEIESGKKKIVGVNAFKDAKPYRIKIHRIDQHLAQEQIANTKAFKKRRRQTPAKSSLEKLGSALKGKENVMPLIIQAVEAKATTGEISNVIREAYGEFHPKPIF
ncbi:MAG TPA: methylmalonyl-CoA mutase family protein, partial [Candidatus Acidoferrales bacterium]|nr:methylmalonyl-CoA mutase family protein [Candidatus Acidoferrales bacterium]